MRRQILGATVGLLLACAAPAQARAPLTVTGARAALDDVCGQRHGVRVATDPGQIAVDRRARVARCQDGRWAPAAAIREPGDYRVALRRQRRYVRVLPRVLETPVSFRVQNVNRTPVPCSSDGETYELRGHLVAPSAALESGRLSAVTLYLHEFSFGSWFWHFKDVPGYDTATDLAARGHASVVIDRLGYAPSPRPNGQATCLGAQADMAHQVLEQLRSGGYQAERPVPAAATAIAGHSVGGGIAELEAITFGDVKALALAGWADQGFAEPATQAALEQGAACTRKGGEPDDYAYFGSGPEQFRSFAFHDADPAVVAAATARRAPDPCGDSTSQPQLLAANNARNGDLAVPVLLLFGADDPVFQPDAPERQAQAYRSSPSVKLVRIPRAAHAVTLERSAQVTRDALAAWLDASGL